MFVAAATFKKDQSIHSILGGRNCFPFDSYENASKTLEKTVHTIEKLMSTNSINSDDSILDVYQGKNTFI